MYITPARIFLLSIIVCAQWAAPVRAQELPRDARPWQVVKKAVQVIGSPEDDIDRKAFQDRLTGEAAAIGADNMRGLWEAYVDVYIDSAFALSPLFIEVPGDPAKKIPARTDTIEQSAVYITTLVHGRHNNYSFFCEKDSLWRIAAWRQFPDGKQRADIADMITRSDGRESMKLSRLLLTDAELNTLFSEVHRDISSVADQLTKSDSWNRLDLSYIAFDSIGEYDALDDNLSPFDKLFYRLNLSALERLRDLGINHITRLALNRKTLLVEVGSWAGQTLGFAYATSTEELPSISKTDFFTLKPLAPNWWLYKRSGNEEYEEPPPLPGSPERKTGKTLLLIPKPKKS